MDTLFWFTVLVIFLASLAGIVVRRVLRDRCLALFDDHHVSYAITNGRVLWGDLTVSSQGLELRYDAPFVTSRGLVKSSLLVFTDRLDDIIGLCRSSHNLTEGERHEREAQVRRTFSPELPARCLRRARNFVGLLRDAITKSLSAFVGTLAARGQMGHVLAGRTDELGELGGTVVTAVTNAYEPLLERHIGKPVILSLDSVGGASEPFSEFPGYLVDYTERFIAVFNVEHTPEELLELEIDASFERPGLTLDVDDGRARVLCTGPDALVVLCVKSPGREVKLGVVLPPGCALGLPLDATGPNILYAERTRYLDWVCPRARARIHFASGQLPAAQRRWGQEGTAPEDVGIQTSNDVTGD